MSKGYILYDSICMTFSKRQNRNDEQISGCRGWIGGTVGLTIGTEHEGDGTVLYPDFAGGYTNLNLY